MADKEVLVLGNDLITVGEKFVDKKSTNIKGDNNTVVPITVNEELYKQSLEKAGLDIKTVIAVSKHNKEYIANIAVASSGVAAKIIEKDKSIDRVVITAPYLADKITSATSNIEVIVDKEKSIRIPGNPTPENRPNLSVKVNNKYQNLGIDVKASIKENLSHLQKLIK